MTLSEIRKKIDELDARLLELLNKRADLVHEIGLLKRKEGGAIYAPEREEQLLKSLVKRNKGRLPETSIRAIYREIMSAALALEKDLTIACPGPVAADTHWAARSKFGASVHYTPQASIAGVFDAVARGTADYGVVPVGNSTGEALPHTLDIFMESDLRVCGQIFLKIENHLVAKIPKNQIRRIYSDPQVLGQCRNWLRHNLPGVDLIEVSSAPRAAGMAASEPHAAAIADKTAAEIHGLQILDSPIRDIPDNTARFFVIGHTASPPTGNDMTSLMLCAQEKAGVLFDVLEPFRRLKINASKIESRPSKCKAGEHCFFVDADGHARDEPLAKALEELRKHCAFVKILGSYPKTAGI